jgi:hypothetical protein
LSFLATELTTKDVSKDASYDLALSDKSPMPSSVSDFCLSFNLTPGITELGVKREEVN